MAWNILLGLKFDDVETLNTVISFLVAKTRPDFAEDVDPRWMRIFKAVSDLDFPEEIVSRGDFVLVRWHDCNFGIAQLDYWAKQCPELTFGVTYVEGDDSDEDEPYEGRFYRFSSGGFTVLLAVTARPLLATATVPRLWKKFLD